MPALTSYTAITGASVTVNAPDSITVNMGNVNPFETKNAALTLSIATSATINDTLRYYPKADPYTTDVNQPDNIDTLLQPVRTSFDPNEKDANAAGRPIADITKEIEYTVRFQNTGTDTAFYVRIADTLSSKLNLASFNFIDASHPVSVEIKNNILQFIFNPIYLADSSHNEPESHGFVKFSLKPAAAVLPGDTIYNNAAIYFDYNSAVITNAAKSWFYSAALPVTLLSFDATPNTSSVLVRFTSTQEINLKNYVIERSSDGILFTAIGAVQATGWAAGSVYSFTDNTPVKPIGFYRLKIVDNNGSFRYSNIAAARFAGNSDYGISIFPNPATDNLLLVFNSNSGDKALYYRVSDMTGRIVKKAAITGTATQNTFSIDIAALPGGVYTVELGTANQTFTQKFIVSRKR